MAFGSKLKDEVEGVIVFVVVVQLDYVLVVELVHDLYFKLDLLDQVMLNNLCLVDHFDGIDILRLFVAHFVDFTESTHTDIGVSKRLEIVFTALSFLTICDRWRQEKNASLDVVDFALELRWDLNGVDSCLSLHNI